MKKTNIGSIDLKTGELLEGVMVYINPKIKWREDWFMGIQEAFLSLAKDKDIAGQPRRVLDYMMGKLAFENYIVLTQAEISEELKIGKNRVSEAIKILLEKGIILKGPKLGRTSSYKLNSNYGWKGKIKNLAEERHLKAVQSSKNTKPKA